MQHWGEGARVQRRMLPVLQIICIHEDRIVQVYVFVKCWIWERFGYRRGRWERAFAEFQ